MKANIIYSTLGAIISGVILIASVFYLTRALDPAEFGKSMLFITVVELLFYLCCMGMDKVFTRFYYDKAYVGKKKLLLQINLIYVIIIAALFFLILLPTSKQVVTFFFGSYTSVFYALLFVNVELHALRRFLMLTVRFADDFFTFALSDIYMQASFFVALLVLFQLMSTHDFYLVVYAKTISMLTNSLLLLFPASKALKTDKLTVTAKSLFNFAKANLCSFIYYGFPFIFSLTFFWLSDNIDKLFIIKLLDYHQLGVYSAAFVLILPAMFIEKLFMTLWVPARNKLLCNNHPEQHAKQFAKIFYWLFACMILMIFLLVLFKSNLAALLPLKYEQSIDFFPWLLFIPFLIALSEITYSGILLVKKSVWHIYISILSLLVNCVLCWLLIPHFGLMGAAIAIFCAYISFYLLRTVVGLLYYSIPIRHSVCCLSVAALVLYIVYNTHWLLALLVLFALVCIGALAFANSGYFDKTVNKKWMVLWR